MDNSLKNEIINLYNKDKFNDIDDLIPNFINTKIVKKNNKTWEKVIVDKSKKINKHKDID